MKLTALLLLTMLIAGCTTKPQAPAAAPAQSGATSTCSPSPTEQCPSDAWLADLAAWKALNADIAKDQQSDFIKTLQGKVDRSVGIQQRMRLMVPQGFDWDDTKQRFVKVPPTIPTQVHGPQPVQDLNRHPVDGLAPNMAAPPAKQPKR